MRSAVIRPAFGRLTGIYGPIRSTDGQMSRLTITLPEEFGSEGEETRSDGGQVTSGGDLPPQLRIERRQRTVPERSDEPEKPQIYRWFETWATADC